MIHIKTCFDEDSASSDNCGDPTVEVIDLVFGVTGYFTGPRYFRDRPMARGRAGR